MADPPAPDDRGERTDDRDAPLAERLPGAAGAVDAGRLAALAVAAAAAAVALVAGAELFPFRSLNHDEGVYLQQAAMLLDGQLFLRPPVEGAFRPWFFVESERGLYSKYQPVPAAVFALGRLLGGYPVALAGVAAGLAAGTVALGRELFDARVGALAGALLLATPLFVVHAGLYLPYALTTALNVGFALWYLRAERRGSVRDAALAGVAVALAFVARPYTAVLFAAPFVLHAAWTLVRSRPWAAVVGDDRGARAGDETETGEEGREGASGMPREGVGGGEREGRGEGETGTDAATRALVARRLVTGALGTAGVLAALGYNAVVTGDPFVFPYLAFAPDDGVGFGRRAILGHEVAFTPALGVRASARVLGELFTQWVVAGPLGAVAAAVGVGLSLAVRAGETDGAAAATGGDGRPATLAGAGSGSVATPAAGDRGRRALLAATYLTVAAGNVAFWGNYNLLGRLDVPDDGLVHFLGPYYHYDLIVPTAVFAAVACVAGADRLRAVAAAAADRRAGVGRREARAAAVAVLLVVGAAGGAAAAAAVAEPVDRNARVTDELRAGYGPLADGGAPDGSVVFLPAPYGPWLNHPFQTLRNDPGYDGPTVYALEDRDELAVAGAFPDRELYRYVYAGSWVPTDDSTVRGALRRVGRASGERIVLDAALGLPEGAESVTVRVTSDQGSAYLTAEEIGSSGSASDSGASGGVGSGGGSGSGGSGALDLRMVVEDGRATVSGPSLTPSGESGGVALAERDEVTVEVFVSTGPASGYSYQIVLPVARDGGTLRALSPTVERCPVPTRCVPRGVGGWPDGSGADVTLSNGAAG